MKIIIAEPIPIDAESCRRCVELGAILYERMPETVSVLVERLSPATIAVVNVKGDVLLDEAVLAQCPQLRTIIVAGSGKDRIDERYARAHGIQVINCPVHSAQAVAEHALALLLAFKRRLFEASTGLQAGHWEQMSLIGSELHGTRLGIIGHGHVGGKIKALAEALSMHVTLLHTNDSPRIIDELIKTSDVVCLSLPLTPETHYFIDERRLQLLGPQSVLLNVGRGATVDQAALERILKKQKIAGALLDVFEDEQDIAAIQRIATLPNVVATPHIAFNTAEAAVRRGPELVACLQQCIAARQSS